LCNALCMLRVAQVQLCKLVGISRTIFGIFDIDAAYPIALLLQIRHQMMTNETASAGNENANLFGHVQQSPLFLKAGRYCQPPSAVIHLLTLPHDVLQLRECQVNSALASALTRSCSV